MTRIFIAGVAALAFSAGVAAAQPAQDPLARAEFDLRQAVQRLSGDVRNTDAQIAPGQAVWAIRRIERVIDGLPADRRDTPAVAAARRELAEARVASAAGTAHPAALRAELEDVIGSLGGLREGLGVAAVAGTPRG